MINNESIFYYTFLEMVPMEREALPPQRALMSTRSEPQPLEMLEAQVIEPLEKSETPRAILAGAAGLLGLTF